MRKFIVLLSAISLTACTTIPQTTNVGSKEEVQQYKQNQAINLITALAVLGAGAYVINKVADDNRNKQCQNNKILYQGLGTKRLYIC
jgi:uncharacterized lipoprotein YehR (DUF1307 family)